MAKTQKLPTKDELRTMRLSPEAFVMLLLAYQAMGTLKDFLKDLETALKRFVNKQENPAMHAALKNSSPLAFALEYVRAKEAHQKKNRPVAPHGPPGKPPAGKAEKQAADFLRKKQGGPVSHPASNPAPQPVPETAEDEDEPDIQPDDFYDMDQPQELQEDLLVLAKSGNHTEAYHAVLLVTALGGGTAMAEKAARVMIDKYRTGTNQEKELCLKGIGGTLGEENIHHVKNDMLQLTQEENDPKLKTGLAALAGFVMADSVMVNLPKTGAADRLRLFTDNKNATYKLDLFKAIPATAPMKNPFAFPKAPKPNFNDPAFGGTKKEEH